MTTKTCHRHLSTSAGLPPCSFSRSFDGLYSVPALESSADKAAKDLGQLNVHALKTYRVCPEWSGRKEKSCYVCFSSTVHRHFYHENAKQRFALDQNWAVTSGDVPIGRSKELRNGKLKPASCTAEALSYIPHIPLIWGTQIKRVLACCAMPTTTPKPTPMPAHSQGPRPHGIHAPSSRRISTQHTSSSPSFIPIPTPKRKRNPTDLHLDLPPANINMAVQPPARPPSRSEFLLRETLLKDELSKERKKGDERSSLGVDESRARAGPGHDHGHRRRASLNRSMTESELARPRPSPSRTTSPSRPPLTPHEQVLRARLERVLSASSMFGYPTPSDPYANEDTNRESRPRHVKRASLPGPARSWDTGNETPSSSESIDHDQDPRGYLATPLTSGGHTPKDLEFFASRATSRSRSRTEPSRPAPHYSPSKPSHQSPKFTRSRSPINSHSQSQSVSDARSESSTSSSYRNSYLYANKGKGRATEDVTEHSELEMITPPPTPPSGTSVMSLPISKSSQTREIEVPHTNMPTTPRKFDAQLASQQCRQLQGYVSFASVEGLGEPVGDEREVTVGTERRRWLGLF
ncbi:hypothetical protein Moror_11979 [Moniliophthora roreri MCA 2997]|uniref:Uncharacterized protein n=2 Tax=Moniliophthora roreri TaxID=221103 RepID=V2Y5T7_MONRO|nr:hypothetical protein Moror_11979 [Moniliophthora roreri MCA 2997]KAI3599111.1 hypothetical protein WG66_004039 [Moniliophthora roreri]